ncbi:MAG TPA: hypothetical protein VG273_19595 [Bryobacteraceae bacterium]|jgi:hypothetical protein|nr:hypothetical protein [Bryobacteraceae bacterium]
MLSRKVNLLFLSIPALCCAATFTASKSGNWNDPLTWGGAGVPGFGDTFVNNQYAVTVPVSTTANLGTVNSVSGTLGDGTHTASLIVNGTLNMRGRTQLFGPSYSCNGNYAVFQMGTGATLNLDENGGSAPSGFELSSSSASPCSVFRFGNPGDTCTWGTATPTCPTNVNSVNNGSANGVLLLDSLSGYGASITTWYGVAVNNCGSSTVYCYAPEFYSPGGSWTMGQVYLNASSVFGAKYTGVYANGAMPFSIDSVISQNRLAQADLFFFQNCNAGVYGPVPSDGSVSRVVTPACTAKTLTNSLVRNMGIDGTANDPWSEGATFKDVFVDGLGSNYPNLTAANIAGGSWSYVVFANDARSCSQDGINLAPGILAPALDHIYSICASTSGTKADVAIIPATPSWGTNIVASNMMFENETGILSHCLFPYGSTQGSGYKTTMSYLASIKTASPCPLYTWGGACAASGAHSVTHAVQPGTGDTAETVFVCENNGVASGQTLVTFKGNIFYDSYARQWPLAFGNNGSIYDASQPANVADPAGTDYNANYNFAAATPARFTTACASGCTNGGTAYNLPTTGAVPGTHDANVNPSFIDNARTAYTWAATRGQAATFAGLKQVFINDGPSRIGTNIAALFYYINSGLIPTARPLQRALTDQTTIGTSQPGMRVGGLFGINAVTQ